MSEDTKGALFCVGLIAALAVGFGFLIHWVIQDGNHRHNVNVKLSAYVEQCAAQHGSIYEKYLAANNETDENTILCIKGTELSKFDNR